MSPIPARPFTALGTSRGEHPWCVWTGRLLVPIRVVHGYDNTISCATERVRESVVAEHDPGKVLETLRNHLTHAEANIAFLLGAGTSCAVRVPFEDEGGETKERSLIPNVSELTTICAKEIAKLDPEGETPRFAPALETLEKEIKPAGRSTNIEDILSA